VCRKSSRTSQARLKYKNRTQSTNRVIRYEMRIRGSRSHEMIALAFPTGNVPRLLARGFGSVARKDVAGPVEVGE
jgi:hypothetical protein